MASLVADDLVAQTGGIDVIGLLREWTWLVPKPAEVLFVTALGDMVMRAESGEVIELDVGAGRLTKLAQDTTEFTKLLSHPEHVQHLFHREIVTQLRHAEMTLRPGQCYGYKLPPPVGGSYEIDNLEPTDLRLHFGLLGQMHRQNRHLRDGTPIRRFVDTGESQ